MRTAATVGALALAALCTGCTHSLVFGDDVDITLDFVPWVPLLTHGTLLNAPYVQGADVSVFVAPWNTDRSMEGATLQSTDPSVFQILDQHIDSDGDIEADCVATGAGDADLVVLRDDGSTWDTAPVHVGFPDRVELHAAGPMFVDMPDLVDAPKVLAGGTATLQVQYFENGRRLHGNGPLAATGDGSVSDVHVERTYLFENREWVQMTAADPGTAQLHLSVDDVPLDAVDVDVVSADALTDMQILGRNESRADDGDWLVLLAQAYDDAADPIFGVDYDWDVDGDVQPGEGDLYRYEYQRGNDRTVTAHFVDLDATVTANMGAGFVDSSNNVGCDSTGGGAVGLFGWLGVLGLVRRRRATAGAAKPASRPAVCLDRR